MPRNKVLEKAKVSFNGDRSAFDLSQVRSFDALAGQLNVCYCQPMVAGTKGKISRKCFTRTASVVSPAFHSITEHFDFFVVPIHSLWRYWENWKLQINDMQDTKLVDFNGLNMEPVLGLPTNVPRTDFNGIIRHVFDFNPQSVEADAQNITANINDALRLIDSLGYSEHVARAISIGGTRVMNLFMLAAYQKCYFDHYRNTAYESNNPYAYNFDWKYDSVNNGLFSPDAEATTPANTKDIYVMKQLLKLRRVNYRNDYFHNIYPSLNYVNSTPNGRSFSVPALIGGLENGGVQPELIASGTSNGGSTYDALAQNSSNRAFVSVQGIRSMFALDKLMRACAYAPKHVRDQYKAQYGVDGVEDFDMKSERIGSFQSDVVLQEVTQMVDNSAAGDPSNLGALGAKGLGSDQGSKPLDFYCKYDSIVIGLHYFVPRARYDAYGLHPWNTKIAQSDFYIKAFENLGLRPFYSTNIDAQRSPVVLGWTVPNFEYKILPDLNTGCFKRKFVQFYTNSYNNQYFPALVGNGASTDPLSSFVPHTEEPLNVSTITAEYFKVAPEDLDNLFAVQVGDDRIRNHYQFFGEFRISVPIVAPMSVHGQPSSVI